MTYPRQIGDVTPEWLNRVLIENGVIDRERIIGFSAAPLEKQGMTSLVHLLSLSYDPDPMPEKAPSHLIFKASLDHPAVRQALAKNLGYRREVAFYNDFGSDPGIPIPRCYASNYDSAENSCMLLMDYIGNTGERDVLSGTPRDIESAVRHLAALHAKWWNKRDVLAKVYPHQVSLLLDTFTETLSRSLKNARDHYREEVGDTLISLLELWLPNAEFFDRRFKDGPVTLIHGDFNRNQLLFPAAAAVSQEDSGRPEGALYVIDWQLTALDPGPTDLAQIIVTGLLPDQRRESEPELLEVYYRLLLHHGVTDYSFEQMLAQYKLGMVKLMLFYLCAFQNPDITPVLEYWKVKGLKGTNFWEVNCRWPAMALEDNGVLDFLTHLLEKN